MIPTKMQRFFDTFHNLGTIGVLLLLLAASLAIWKWGARYRTNKARIAAVLMIAGFWIGIAVPMGMILVLVGLIIMLVARSDFLRPGRGA